jgi:hypothetical protein
VYDLLEDEISIEYVHHDAGISLCNGPCECAQLAKRLFDVDIKAVDGQVPVSDESVRFFCVQKDGKPKAYFFLDPYSRPAEKRSGAWMDEVAGQSKLVCPGCLPHMRKTHVRSALAETPDAAYFSRSSATSCTFMGVEFASSLSDSDQPRSGKSSLETSSVWIRS